MTSLLSTAALFPALAAPAATTAGELSLDAPMAGASLATGEIAKSVYYIPSEDPAFVDALEAVATYVPHAAADEPRRMVMALADGDRVRFAVPGHAGTLVSVERAGASVRALTQCPSRPTARRRSG